MWRETAEEPEAADPELPEADETAAEEEVEVSEQDPQLETDETSAAEEEPVTLEPDPEPELEPPLPEQIPEHIFKTVRAVMGVFTETRPDDYVARLEASPSEWMTITDDSLSNELERELLTSAAAMCLWQEWMVWYQGENASAFTDNFGKIGPVFIRGAGGPVAYRVQAEIGAETLVGIMPDEPRKSTVCCTDSKVRRALLE